jgi:magnesium transporter
MNSDLKENETEKDRSPDPDDLEELLKNGSEVFITRFLKTLHPADLAILFEHIDQEYWPRVVANLRISEISDLLEELDDHLRDDFAEMLRHDQLVKALLEMDSDDAADVIADLPEEMAQAVLDDIPDKDRIEVETLLKYPEDSAGGLMQVELISVTQTSTVDQAVEAIRAEADNAGKVHSIYMVDEHKHLTGVLPLDSLLLAQPHTVVSELAVEESYSVNPHVDQEEVARMFQRYDLVSMAVVDKNNTLLGRITHDDVIDVMEEEIEEDILRMAGAEESELLYTNRIFKIASVRLPWLMATIAGGLLSGVIVKQFEISFPQLLALLTFFPVIAAMGGNIGSQSSTIVIRGFATGHIDFNNLKKFLVRELAIGGVIGTVCGLVVGIVARIWEGNTVLGLTVGLSMTLAISASACTGVLVPFFFRLVRIDPAIAAGPLVTTANDVLGLFIYFLVAMLIIS